MFIIFDNSPFAKILPEVQLVLTRFAGEYGKPGVHKGLALF
jgi:hypothetical protein